METNNNDIDVHAHDMMERCNVSCISYDGYDIEFVLYWHIHGDVMDDQLLMLSKKDIRELILKYASRLSQTSCFKDWYYYKSKFTKREIELDTLMCKKYQETLRTIINDPTLKTAFIFED
jgi:hypothetical protein